MAIEQTNVVVFRPPALERVAAPLRASGTRAYLEALDGEWDALYLLDGALDGPPVRGAVLDLSRAVPLLYFRYSEDYSWRYAVFDGGAEVAAVLENFELWHPLAEALAHERGMTRGEFYWRHGDEVQASPGYRVAFMAQFDRRNVTAFAAFGLERRRLHALEALLTGGDPEDGYRRVETFRRLLRLEAVKRKNFQDYADAERHPERARDPTDSFWSGIASGRILALPDAQVHQLP